MAAIPSDNPYYVGDKRDTYPTGSRRNIEYSIIPLVSDEERQTIRKRALRESEDRRKSNNKAWANQREHLTKGKKY